MGMFTRMMRSISHWGIHDVGEQRVSRPFEELAKTSNPILDDVVFMPAAGKPTLSERIAQAAESRTQPTKLVTQPAASPVFGSERYLLLKAQRYAKHPELGLVAVLSEAETSPYAIVVTSDRSIRAVCFWSLAPEITPKQLKDEA